MTNTTQGRIAEYRAWKKGHPDYPLTVHPSGQWSKRIRGKLHYFGRLEDPDHALQLWAEEREYLEAGLVPPENNGSLTVGALAGKHLADVDDRIAAGRLVPVSRRIYTVTGKLLAEAHLSKMPIGSIGPEHFTWALSENSKEPHSCRQSDLQLGSPDGAL
jgi:hypothetical protein